MTLYLNNASYIDWQNFEIHPTDIEVSEGASGGIRFLEPTENINQIKTPGDSVIDCQGKYVTRSFVCGHHHAYSALARGMPAPEKSPTNFRQILEYVWWNLDRNLDREMVEASALSTAMACAKNGVTFVIDHHSSPFAITGSLELMARAFDKVGVSHLLCCELSDRDGPEAMKNGLRETDDYLTKGKQGLVGLHASFTVGDDLLKEAVGLAEKHQSGIHVHVAEDACDQEITKGLRGVSVIERFKQSGALEFEKTILAHCLHLSDKEREILKDSPAHIVLSIESNLNNNVGFFSPHLIDRRIMLGTDGMHSDMLRSAQACYFVGQGTEQITPDAVYQRFRTAHHYLMQNSFEGDGENNLVVLDYDPPTEMKSQNFPGHFVFGIEAGHIDTVISNGIIVVDNRKLTTVDEADINLFCREMATRLWNKL